MNTPLMVLYDMTPEDWRSIAEDIAKRTADDYDGFLLFRTARLTRWRIPPARYLPCSKISVTSHRDTATAGLELRPRGA